MSSLTRFLRFLDFWPNIRKPDLWSLLTAGQWIHRQSDYCFTLAGLAHYDGQIKKDDFKMKSSFFIVSKI